MGKEKWGKRSEEKEVRKKKRTDQPVTTGHSSCIQQAARSLLKGEGFSAEGCTD